MTASELKYHVEQSGNEPHFFTRSTMKFFGDRMSNYGCRETVIDTYNHKSLPVYELHRKKPVKMGLKDSSYFRKDTFERVFKER